MEEVVNEWFGGDKDWARFFIKVIVTICLFLVGTFITFWRLRVSAKQKAKQKWSEELREAISEFQANVIMTQHSYAEEQHIKNDLEEYYKWHRTYVDSMMRVNAHRSRVSLLLDSSKKKHNQVKSKVEEITNSLTKEKIISQTFESLKPELDDLIKEVHNLLNSTPYYQRLISILNW